MNHDTLLRAAAVVAAVALLASPYWPVIGRAIATAAKAADAYRTDFARSAAAILLILAACGSVLLPAIRQDLRAITPAGVVTALKVVVGLVLVARAFVETARLGQAAVDAHVKAPQP